MGFKKKKILVLGGSRYFGKQLTEKLVSLGHQVFTFNRGNTQDTPGAQGIRGDRTSTKDLASLSKYGPFDIIYDQICMDIFDAEHAAKYLLELSPHYIMTSTQSVYDQGAFHKEDSLEPAENEKKYRTKENYGLAKRQADLFLLDKLPEKTTTLRIPIVLGTEDYTERLHWHIKKNLRSDPVFFPNIDAELNFILSEDLVEKMIQLGEIDFRGAINLCSETPITLKDLLTMIEKSTGKGFRFSEKADDVSHSPFGISETWTMNISKAKSLNLLPSPLEKWLPPLIDDLRVEIEKTL